MLNLVLNTTPGVLVIPSFMFYHLAGLLLYHFIHNTEIECYTLHSRGTKAVVGGTAGPAMAGPLFWPKMVLAGPLFWPIMIFFRLT